MSQHFRDQHFSRFMIYKDYNHDLLYKRFILHKIGTHQKIGSMPAALAFQVEIHSLHRIGHNGQHKLA